MANEVFVDPVTSAKPRSSLRQFAIPALAALIVMIVGMVYVLSQALTVVRVMPKITMTDTGFYNTSRKLFIPRGTNFVRLATSPSGLTYHSTFEPGQYTAANAQAVLNGIKNSGYNTVRIFIDPGEFTTPSHGISTGINSQVPIKPEYMANVVDFIKQAGSRGIYTIPIIDGIPANTFYYQTAGSPTGNIQGNNVLYLDPRYVQAKEIYVKQFISSLLAGLGTGRSSILAYATDNEVFFETNHPPFSTMAGSLTSLDGVTYDMSKPATRQQAADANLVVYSARMKQAIASVDPQGLLTLGFFTNNAVGKTAFNGAATYCSTDCTSTTNYRLPGRASAVSAYGKADFIDMHVYPSSATYSLKNDLTSSEYHLFKKPYILGEFGALKSVYPTATSAATGMKNLQTASCSLGAKGWLFWTWDTSLTTSLASQKKLYSLMENNGAIDKLLAPTARADACQ